MKTNDKYIDMNQFPHNKNGTISWKNSVGIIADFSIYDKIHKIEILEVADCAHIKVRIDKDIVKTVQSNDIINLFFEKLFYESTYRYNIGDIIDSIEILDKTKIEHSKSKKYS